MPLVYEKYKIDSTRFNRSNKYYTSKIEPYKDILGKVKEKIQIEYDSFQKEFNIKDSLKVLKNKERKDKRRKKDSVRRLEKLIKSDSILNRSKNYFLKLNLYVLDTSLITSEIGSKE